MGTDGLNVSMNFLVVQSTNAPRKPIRSPAESAMCGHPAEAIRKPHPCEHLPRASCPSAQSPTSREQTLAVLCSVQSLLGESLVQIASSNTKPHCCSCRSAQQMLSSTAHFVPTV